MTIINVAHVKREPMYIATEQGIMKRIETWEVIIPLQDNEKKDFPPGTFEKIREEIIKTFGGATVYECFGYWQNYVDKNNKISVDIPSQEHGKAARYFCEVKPRLQKRLRQDSIYVTSGYSKEVLLTNEEFFQELGCIWPTMIRRKLNQVQIDDFIEQVELGKLERMMSGNN
jgi:hypothetical protein